jgi:hypothetical protein
MYASLAVGSSPCLCSCVVNQPRYKDDLQILKNVANVIYFVTTIKNQNCIHEEIKRKLNLLNDGYN